MEYVEIAGRNLPDRRDGCDFRWIPPCPYADVADVQFDHERCVRPDNNLMRVHWVEAFREYQFTEEAGR